MLKWLGKGSNLENLIASKNYRKAVALIREQLQAKENRDNLWLIQQLALVLELDGQKDEAVKVLEDLADRFVKDNYLAKAVAVIKNIHRLAPDRPGLEEKLAETIGRQTAEATRKFYPAGVRPTAAAAPGTAPAGPPQPTEAAQALKTLPLRPPPPPDQPLRPSVGAPSAPAPGFQGVKGSPLFSEFAPHELAAFMRGLTLKSFSPGEIIVTEGEPGDSLFVLAGGRVRVYVRDERSRNQMVRALDEGAFFGEISLVTGQPRSATITAASSCDILELDQAALKKIGEQHPKVSEVITDFCNRRHGSPEEKLARGELDERAVPEIDFEIGFDAETEGD